jgi:hypothetical protein
VFEVSFVNDCGNRERHVVKAHWLARQIARDAIRNGSNQITVRLLRMDLLIVKPDGQAVLIYEKLTPTKAARLSRDWACENRETGIILWPSGRKIPKRFVIQQAG